MAYWRDLTNVWSANRILNEKGSFTLVTRNNIKVMDLVRKQCPICRRLDPMLPFMTLYLYNVPFGFATLRFTFTTPCFFRDKSDPDFMPLLDLRIRIRTAYISCQFSPLLTERFNYLPITSVRRALTSAQSCSVFIGYTLLTYACFR